MTRHRLEGIVEIYLLRHGPAVEGPEARGMSDRDRPLSVEGRGQTERAAEGLAAAGIRFDRIVSSPLRRALETAQAVAAADLARNGTAPEVEETDELAGGVAPRSLFDWLLATPPGSAWSALLRIPGVARPGPADPSCQVPGGTDPGGAIGSSAIPGDAISGEAVPGHAGSAHADPDRLVAHSSDTGGADTADTDTDRCTEGHRSRSRVAGEGLPGKTSAADRHPLRLLLVGHQPDMGVLSAHLLGVPASRAIPFEKGTLVRIDLEGFPPDGPGRLAYVLPMAQAARLCG